LRELGLIVRPIGALNIISPPLILGEAEIEALAAILRRGIEATMADLAAEGLWRN
jgi:Adenosylmethionine-8-amino-7-oxononanoate aminotransferase